MEKDFLPYEQSLALKEVGFDVKCIKGFYEKEELYTVVTTPVDFNNKSSLGVMISCPLFQQAFRWFREKYKLHAMIDDNGTETTYYYSWRVRYSYSQVKSAGDSDTYEEAELSCLKELIEMVKTRNNGRQN